MANHKSVKHVQIDKVQSQMIAVVAVAVALSIFSLFGIKAMIVKGAYQRRVVNEKHKVLNQLKTNYDNAQTLETQYKVFVDQNPNIIGGIANGTGNSDGDNSRIVLDALPSQYDAPALATSVEKILNGENLTIRSINVKDDPTSNPDTPLITPQPTIMSFSFEGSTSFAGAQSLLKDFEKSIRPFDVTTLEVSGSDNNLLVSVNMNTYFQAARSLDLQATKVVK